MEYQQQQRLATASKRRRRRGDICWKTTTTTALMVCLATLQQGAEGFVFPTPRILDHRSSTNGRKVRSSSIPLGAARHKKDDPWSLSSSTTQQRRKSSSKNGQTTKTDTRPANLSSIADASYQLLDHELLTKAEEYELGLQIRKFIDTKQKMEEMIEAKKKEYELRKQENQRRREKAAEDKHRRRRMRTTEGDLWDLDGLDGDFTMEEELEEFLQTKGLVPGNKYQRGNNSRSRHRHSIEYLYGTSEEEDDEEEAMMEELGMAIYGIDHYDHDEENDLDVLMGSPNSYSYESYKDDYSEYYDDAEDDSSLPEVSVKSQLGDTMDDIQLLTEREIIEDLGVSGGRAELSQIFIDGALAKQQMIKSNVRLVTSIAKKWMRTSKGSVHANRNTDSEKKLKGSGQMGDWSTPSLDEVIQQGIVGLAIAAERFEPERKFKFSTYATYYITNEVRQIMQSATTQCLYVPPYFYTIKNKYERIVRDNYRNTAGDPSLALDLEEIASQLKLKKTRLEFILKSTQSLVQLDATVNMNSNAGKAGGGSDSDSAETLSDILPSSDPTPEEIVERSLLRQCLENALAAELLPLERDIVRLRHGLDDGKSRTHKEVMGSFGGMLSLNDIRTAETRAYRKLRHKNSVHNARLREFAAEYIGVAPEQLKAA